MTQEQRNRLEYEAWKDTEQYADQMKERGAIDSYKQGFINGAEWMEQNQWTPIREGLPKESGQYDVTTFLRSGARIVETWGFDANWPDEDKEEWRDRVAAWKFPTQPYSPPKPQENA